MSIDISIPANDGERLGFIDENRTPVYPAHDIFGGQILVRSAMQVHWLGERFICFPPQFDMQTVDIIAVEGDDYTDAILIMSKDAAIAPLSLTVEDPSNSDLDTDEDRDTEDSDLTPVGDSLQDLTKTQLLALAEERGLSLSDRLNKQAMIDALLNQDAE